jgi:hypothetical protein
LAKFPESKFEKNVNPETEVSMLLVVLEALRNFLKVNIFGH